MVMEPEQIFLGGGGDDWTNIKANSFQVMDNSSELWPPRRDPLYIVIPVTIIYCVIFVTGLVGNVITCLVIHGNKHMHTATNYYLFSLAISDLLLLLTGLPPEIYSIWSKFPYVFGEAFCVARGLAAETSANATVLTITAFTVERYVAICHPFQAHAMSQLSRAFKIVIGIWLIALGFAIPQALQFGVVGGDHPDSVQCTVKRVLIEYSFELSTILFFLAPMSLITILYLLIGLKLRRTALDRSKGSFSNRHISSTGPRHQASQRVLKMLVAVVVAFFICWAPFHTQRLVFIYGTDDGNQPTNPGMIHVYAAITYTSGVLYYMSATINPILYHIMSLKFREAFKGMLWRGCKRGGVGGGSSRWWRRVGCEASSSGGGQTDSGICLQAPSTRLLSPLLESKINGTKIKTRPWIHPAARSLSAEISNSSLKNCDRLALQDELDGYDW